MIDLVDNRCTCVHTSLQDVWYLAWVDEGGYPSRSGSVGQPDLQIALICLGKK